MSRMSRRRRSAGQEFVATVRYVIVLIIFALVMWNVVRPIMSEGLASTEWRFGQPASPTAAP
jgi:cytochrome oxidase assembly protein ShyY1